MIDAPAGESAVPKRSTPTILYDFTGLGLSTFTLSPTWYLPMSNEFLSIAISPSAVGA